MNLAMLLSFLPLSSIHIHRRIRLEHDMAYTLKADDASHHQVYEFEKMVKL